MKVEKISGFSNQSRLIFLVSLACIMAVYGIITVGNISSPDKNISRGVNYYEDRGQNLDLSSVQDLPAELWQQEESELLSFGISENPYWLKFPLEPLDQEKKWLLELDYALLDSVSIWFLRDQMVIKEYHVGDSLPFAQRGLKHEKFLLPIPPSKQALTVFIRLETSGILRLPIRLWPESAYTVFSSEHSIVMGLFFGFMAAMGLSNFFFFITTRLNTFLVYSGFVLCLSLTLAALHGLGYKYLWPNSPWFQAHSVGIFANATVMLAIIFTDVLLNVRQYSRAVSMLMRVTAGFFLFFLFISLLLPYSLFVQGFLVLLSLVVVLVQAVGVWLWIKGVLLARLYTLAWTALLVSGFMASLDNLNLLALNVPSHYLLMLGATIETFLVALILALSYGQQRQKMFDAQESSLNKERQARNAQEEILAVQKRAKEELEYSVQERTLELEIALRELSETNQELEQKNTLDALTGIRNRSYFDKKYTAEVRRSRRERTELSIVMLDIDHFKRVNDDYGHLVGDECIKFVASTLENALKRPSDDACRYGGEEFALILPSTDLEGATNLVETVRKDIENHVVEVSGVNVKLTVSAGIGTAIVDPQQSEDAILAFADQQLYLAKNDGRNRVKAARYIPATINQQDHLDV
jgi:diguanylate cyclase (GGDEF)-like protein